MMHTQIFCDLCFWNFIRPTCNYRGECLHIYKLLFRHEGQGQPLSFKVPGIDTRGLPADKGAEIWLIMGCVCRIDNTISLLLKPQMGHLSWAWKLSPSYRLFCRWFHFKSLMTIDSWCLYPGRNVQDASGISGWTLFYCIFCCLFRLIPLFPTHLHFWHHILIA